MFFINYRKLNTLKQSTGIPLASLKTKVQKTLEEKDEDTGEIVNIKVEELVGTFTDDSTNKNVYLEALDTKSLGGGVHEVYLVETPVNKHRDFLYIEANPNAIALGMIHTQVILKVGEDFRLFTKGDPKKLLLLDWVIKLSVIRGERN